MHYNCDEINRILESDYGLPFDEEAFLQHVENCPVCAKLGTPGHDAELAVMKYMADDAPPAILINVMQTIKRNPASYVTNTRVRLMGKLLLGAIYVFIGIIGVINHRAISAVIGSSLRDAYQILNKIDNLSKAWNSVTAFTANVTLTPLMLAILLGGATLVWMLSIIRFREIIK